MRKIIVLFVILMQAAQYSYCQTHDIKRIPVEIKPQQSTVLASKVANARYVTYKNNDYGYTFQYPDFMKKYVGDDMDSSKGIVVSWNNQVAINTWVDEADGDTPQSLWNTLKENKDIRYTYHRIIGNTLFSSGFLANGNIIYDKWVFQGGYILSVSLEYPAGNKRDMDPVVKKVASSFRSTREKRKRVF